MGGKILDVSLIVRACSGVELVSMLVIFQNNFLTGFRCGYALGYEVIRMT